LMLRRKEALKFLSFKLNAEAFEKRNEPHSQ
jgi:hypothetical protein